MEPVSRPASRVSGPVSGSAPLPLSAVPSASLRQLQWILADIDDTITTDGRLTAAAYQALEALEADGLKPVLVTGRPAGWCDMIARFFPVDAVVGENGAFWFRYERASRRMRRGYFIDAAERARARARLDRLAAAIPAAVPGAAVAADQAYRIADLAIDFAEDTGPLTSEQIEQIVRMFREAGAEAKVSSIHVNGWFGDYDKLRMTERLFAEAYGVDLGAVLDRIAFIGDSANDEPMFARFPWSFGVANVKAFLPRMKTGPAYVTTGEAGAGFVEFAAAVLDARRPRTARP
ncbi:MAG TPA: HAD-IIB family hydrolase [Alphaproteobacteria bacterium]